MKNAKDAFRAIHCQGCNVLLGYDDQGNCEYRHDMVCHVCKENGREFESEGGY